MINIQDFKKVELVVARILEVKDHPQADKLLVLKVDLGTEQRVLVAGLKGHYSPQELEGKQVIVVSNLEPATIRGIQSQGMLLACQDKERVVIISPEKEVEPGSKVL